ncbi:MAG: hypothetical protein JSS90_02500 [Bacteroidetes bacterium]|jgi:hypothetical protein|nr:hypothetical protein [Bacteroidota bacterium]
MSHTYPKYLLQLAGVAILYSLLYFMMRDILASRFYEGFWKIAVFYFLLFAVIHYLRLRQSTGNSSIRFFMASTTIKLFLLLIILAFYFFINPQSAIPFAISFLIAYFLFMIFDVAKAYKLMKNNS